MTPTLELLVALGRVLAILVGLVAALAVQLIFVDWFLPQLVPGSDDMLYASVADIAGFLVFSLLARSAVDRASRSRRRER